VECFDFLVGIIDVFHVVDKPCVAACAVFISGCRAGMLCVALMMGMLLAACD